mmetsp:Transcript_30376/g.60346  ORF Transcript_30376/g.60346 Transcript_30376/m.60346 type:complete len:121 (+) Transcript_30376:772-1134(+)
MYGSFRKLAELPKDTLVYCGHEYTISNYEFASRALPTNEKVRGRAAWAKARRERGEHTVPSTIGDEMECNVFMLAAIGEANDAIWDEVKARCGCDKGRTFQPVELMGICRRAKDKRVFFS